MSGLTFEKVDRIPNRKRGGSGFDWAAILTRLAAADPSTPYRVYVQDVTDTPNRTRNLKVSLERAAEAAGIKLQVATRRDEETGKVHVFAQRIDG